MDITDELFRDDTDLGEAIEGLLESEDVQIPESLHQQYLTSLGLKLQLTQAQYRALHAKYTPIIERMQVDLNMLKQKEARLKMLVSLVLPPGPSTAYVDDNVRFFYLQSDRVEITNPASVPLDLCVTKTEPSKTLIEQRFESGQEVPGANRITSFSLQVKPGGANAKKNEASRQRNLRKKQESKIN